MDQFRVDWMNSHNNRKTKSSGTPWRRGRKALVAVVVGLILWFIGDLGYATYVHQKVQKWEQQVQRDSKGIQAGFPTYCVGDKQSETACLLVHGINDSPRVFRKLAPVLADQGIYCLCIRLPGFGESLDQYGAHDRDDWIQAVSRELRRLKKQHRKVILIGHSLGGAICLASAIENRLACDGLVLVAPAIEVSNSRSPVIPVRTWHRILSRSLMFTDTLYSPFGIDVLDPNEKENPERIPFTPLAVVDQTFCLIRENRNAAHSLVIPTQVFLAEHDRVVDNDAAERFYEQIPVSGKELVWLNHSAHAIPLDYDWKKFAQITLGFIARSRQNQ